MINNALTQTSPTTSQQQVWVQFGCGLCAPKSWLNFDSSLTSRLQHLPLLGPLIPSGPYGRYPINVKYGDIVRGLPISNGSVDLLYCSHVLEHLTLEELRQALVNCCQYLKPGGIFRLVVPDLKFLVTSYLHSEDPEAAHQFMRQTWLGKESYNRNLIPFLKEWLTRNHHLWMFDYNSLSLELSRAGFKNIRRAYYDDSGIAAFSDVEDSQRWTSDLGIQCSN